MLSLPISTLVATSQPLRLYYLVYTSTITLSASIHPMTLHNIYLSSKRNNSRAGLQGFTLFKRGKFLQYMEGDEMSIANLYSVIERDPRHKNIQIIDQGNTPLPHFIEWEMYHLSGLMSDRNAGEEINALLASFNTYHWNAQDVDQLVQDFSTYHHHSSQGLHGYEVKVGSYAMTVIKQFLLQHFTFLMVQFILLVMIALMVIYWFNHGLN